MVNLRCFHVAYTYQHNSLLSIQAILRFNLLEFPGGKEEVTFAELAESCGQTESEIRRLLRHAMAYRIFAEPRKGYVRHTAASKKLADPLMKAWLGFVTEELCPSAVKTVDALQKWPEAQEPNQTGFALANDTEEVFFAEIPKFPVREARYADAMAWFSSAPGFGPEGLVNAIPWGGYETVVDVGGNIGLASQAIARAHEGVKLIVQDLPDPVAEGRAKLDPMLQERVSFMEHDFFNEQTIRADVYLLRWILHDWSDKYAIKILQALIPALKRGARVVLNEFVLPPPGIASTYISKVLRRVNMQVLLKGFHTDCTRRTMDLSMLELHNGKERDADDWEQLFRDCDSRFKFLGTTRVPGSRFGIVEAKWEP